jgi:2-amino-4-hydroxy-6-hydroxymethyldihydropteridine diphosphokinase
VFDGERDPRPDEAWIGFGSNLGDREAAIGAALRELGDLVTAISPVWETAPWGVLDQPWFLNGVAQLRWTGSARELLETCLAVERRLGRVRGGPKFGPRGIDLDVLVCGPGCVREDGLIVPHPGIAERRSVLEPWADLAPELRVPGLGETVGILRDRARARLGREQPARRR